MEIATCKLVVLGILLTLSLEVKEVGSKQKNKAKDEMVIRLPLSGQLRHRLSKLNTHYYLCNGIAGRISSTQLSGMKHIELVPAGMINDAHSHCQHHWDENPQVIEYLQDEGWLLAQDQEDNKDEGHDVGVDDGAGEGGLPPQRVVREDQGQVKDAAGGGLAEDAAMRLLHQLWEIGLGQIILHLICVAIMTVLVKVCKCRQLNNRTMAVVLSRVLNDMGPEIEGILRRVVAEQHQLHDQGEGGDKKKRRKLDRDRDSEEREDNGDSAEDQENRDGQVRDRLGQGLGQGLGGGGQQQARDWRLDVGAHGGGGGGGATEKRLGLMGSRVKSGVKFKFKNVSRRPGLQTYPASLLVPPKLSSS